MGVLVVDDSRAMRSIVRRALRQSRYGEHHVDEAENGREALDYLRCKRPEFVLCDWNMPVLSGVELLHALRDEGVHARVGLVTSESTPEKAAEARAAGARFLLTKPFDSETLERALDDMMSDHIVAQVHTIQTSGRAVGGFFLPDVDGAKKLLSKLLGKPTSCIEWAKPLDLRPGLLIGTYTSHGRPVAQVWMDIHCSVYAGAALMMMPCRIAEQSVKTYSVGENLSDAVGEVFNVFGRLFQRPGGDDLKLAEWGADTKPMRCKCDRLDLAIDIPGYGKGRIALLVVP